MRNFDIVSVQDDPELTFNMSHTIYHLLVPKINSYIKESDHEIMPDFETLIFSISAKKDILNYEIGGSMKSKKTSTLTMFIHISDRYITLQDDYILHLKLFDFRKKENSLRVYSVEKYIEFVLLAFDEIVPNVISSTVKDDLLKEVSDNPNLYKYKNEEQRYLEYLASEEGKEWLNSDSGIDFRDSDIGEKWSKLVKKYKFDKKGNVIFE